MKSGQLLLYTDEITAYAQGLDSLQTTPVINRLMVYLRPAIVAIFIQVATLLALYLLTD